MNILSLFAKTTDYTTSYNSSLSDSDTAALMGVFAVVWLFWLIVAIGTYVFISICLMRIFKKAGIPAWAAWVPFVNTWKILELGGQQGFWAILAIIPIVNIASSVFTFIAMYHIGKSFGKEGSFVLWAIFIPYVWFIWLAFDKSQWNPGGYVAAPAPVDPTPPAPLAQA